MSRFLILSVLISLIFVAAILTGFSDYTLKALIENQQEKLRVSCNYATDAAVDEMLEQSGNLESMIPGKLMLNPQVALDEFVDVLLLNYGVPVNDDNRTMVRTRFITMFVVVTYDGFYVAKRQQVDKHPQGTGYDLVFSPKYPYTYVDDPDNPTGSSWVANPDGTLDRYKDIDTSNNTYYGLTLMSNYHYKVNELNNVQFLEGVPGRFTSMLNPIESTRTEINKIISEYILSESSIINRENPNWENDILIPVKAGNIEKNNPIMGPSVIAVLQNVDLESARKVSTLSIGGSVIQDARFVVGYMDEILDADGVSQGFRKLYCWADEAPSDITPTELFTSPEDAARAGYFCDIRYWNKDNP